MEDNRSFCKPITGGHFFSAFDLKKATKTTLFERFLLWFVKPKYEVDHLENHTLKYKVLNGKIYILAHWINPPKQWNCRHQIVKLS